ncbi:hypothetical protein AB9Q10_41465 [Streptomyces krungchingensis]|uniref:hypothetical protein n=1 Tax=Streptomyces krungchingensis TaxID=1565034 RepID=UPI003CFAF7E0
MRRAVEAQADTAPVLDPTPVTAPTRCARLGDRTGRTPMALDRLARTRMSP